ncbi:hypothetical protein SALBM135S_01710 [Streptomyces alboniger]
MPPVPKLRQRPSSARNPRQASCRYFAGWLEMLTPPATATSQSPERIAWQAWWMVTRAEEHMVSTATLGPEKSKKYDTRLATEANDECGGSPSPRSASWTPYSWYWPYIMPTNTPVREARSWSRV